MAGERVKLEVQERDREPDDCGERERTHEDEPEDDACAHAHKIGSRSDD